VLSQEAPVAPRHRLDLLEHNDDDTGKEVTMSAPEMSFDSDIKPLFREKDRDSMRRAFDLWSYADVQVHADAIAERLKNGTMPCDGAWPAAQVGIFERWVEQGKPE
jgi:hypothetical protein